MVWLLLNAASKISNWPQSALHEALREGKEKAAELIANAEKARCSTDRRPN